MPEEIKIILELSDEAQTFLDQQGIDLHQELQRELPSIQVGVQSDPEAPSGSRDIATVIFAAASLVSALTPIILRILNQFTPPNRSETWMVEEVETHHADGSISIHHKRVLSSREQRLSEPLIEQPKTSGLSQQENVKEIKG
jgi:hypothetical protein